MSWIPMWICKLASFLKKSRRKKPKGSTPLKGDFFGNEALDEDWRKSSKRKKNWKKGGGGVSKFDSLLSLSGFRSAALHKENYQKLMKAKSFWRRNHPKCKSNKFRWKIQKNQWIYNFVPPYQKKHLLIYKFLY